MRITLCSLMFSMILGFSATAFGQYPGYGVWGGPGPGWGGGSYRHASTAEEGIARGVGEVIRASGAANLMHSEAAKNYEDARKKYIDNRLYQTQTYFEMRRVNRQARWAERPPKPTQQDLIRYSQQRMPKRLNTSDLDPLNGRIIWPPILQMPQYAAGRNRLDQLYAERAKNGYLTPDQLLEIDGHIKGMQEVLKANLKTYPPQMYTESKNFLQSLSYESMMRPS